MRASSSIALSDVPSAWASPTTEADESLRAPPETSNFRLAGEEIRLAENRQNLGLLGKLFGSRDTAPTNSAGLAILLGLFFFIGSYLLMPSPELSPVQAGALGVVGSALGYIFGSASRIER